MIQTGLPRHATVFSSPSRRSSKVASTGPPSARARSEGSRLATNGYAAAMIPAPPTAPVAARRMRRLPSGAGGESGLGPAVASMAPD